MRCLILLLPAVISAATLHVPGDYPAIQEAIDASTNGDSVLVAPGTYVENIDFNGKNIVLKSELNAEVTIIEAAGTGPVVCFENGETSAAILEGFTVCGGYGSSGRGISIHSSDPTVIGNIITGNLVTASMIGRGAGIWCYDSESIIQRNYICNNTLSISGYMSEGRGAGIHIFGGSPFLLNNHILNNVCILNDIHEFVEGIAVYVKSSGLEMVNCVVAGNTHEGYYPLGGFPYTFLVILADSTTLTNVTIAFNEGIGLTLRASTGCTIRNSIVWENDPNHHWSILLVNTSQILVEYCDIQFGLHSVYSGPGSTFNWGEGNIEGDPIFFDGGSLSGYHLTQGLSPCIDAGHPGLAFNDPEDPVAPEYALWPALGGLRNDMGAYGGPGAIYWSNPGTGIGVHSEPVQPWTPVLVGVFPNPSQNAPVITFDLPEMGDVHFSVFDITGRLVDSVQSTYSSGRHCVVLNYLVPGIYLVRMSTGDFMATQRFVVIE